MRILETLLNETRDFFAAWAITLCTGFVFCWFLQNQVLDAYTVPTASMEPTIEGDEHEGDRVLVDKTFDNRTRPERWDMIVFRHVETGKNLVKRVVGMPGEFVQILDEDIFAGRSKTDLARVVKDVVAHADLRAVFWDSLRSKGGFGSRRFAQVRTRRLGDGGIEIDGGDIRRDDLFSARELFARRRNSSSVWNLRLSGHVTTGYIDGFDRFHGRRLRARDFGVEIEFERADASVATLWVELRFARNSFALSLGADGEAELWQNGRRRAVLREGAARSERRTSLVFMYLDGGFVLAVDGVTAGRAEVDPYELLRGASDRLLSNGLALAATGGKLRVARLRIVHDFHYIALGLGAAEPIHVAEGHYFVLGDNSLESEDSRRFGLVPEENILGRPLLVGAPLDRFHVFRR